MPPSYGGTDWDKVSTLPGGERRRGSRVGGEGVGGVALWLALVKDDQ